EGKIYIINIFTPLNLLKINNEMRGFIYLNRKVTTANSMKLSEEQYPVLELLPEVAKQFLSHNTLILQAPPGAGKSTALPLSFLSGSLLDDEKIIMLQPRRLAAKAVATRMSQLLNEKV